jgi:hypothetical protein
MGAVGDGRAPTEKLLCVSGSGLLIEIKKPGRLKSSRFDIDDKACKATRLFELVPAYHGAAQEPFSFAGPQLRV